MKALIATVLAVTGLGLGFAASWEADIYGGHIPLVLGIPAITVTLVAGVLLVQVIRADTRRWKAVAANLQAVTVTVTRVRQHEPAQVSIETGHTIIDLVPVDVRELAS